MLWPGRERAFRAWRNYANTLARPALRRANIVEETWLHIDCCFDAGAWHRREHIDLPVVERGAAAHAACTEPGGARRGADCAAARPFGEFQWAAPGADQSALGD